MSGQICSWLTHSFFFPRKTFAFWLHLAGSGVQLSCKMTADLGDELLCLEVSLLLGFYVLENVPLWHIQITTCLVTVCSVLLLLSASSLLVNSRGFALKNLFPDPPCFSPAISYHFSPGLWPYSRGHCRGILTVFLLPIWSLLFQHSCLSELLKPENSHITDLLIWEQNANPCDLKWWPSIIQDFTFSAHLFAHQFIPISWKLIIIKLPPDVSTVLCIPEFRTVPGT